MPKLSLYILTMLVALSQAADLLAAESPTADTLFFNGQIYTLDANKPWVEAVAIAGDTIIYTGDRAGAENILTEHTRRYDLAGKMMLPGFIDTPILRQNYGDETVDRMLDYLQ